MWKKFMKIKLSTGSEIKYEGLDFSTQMRIHFDKQPLHKTSACIVENCQSAVYQSVCNKYYRHLLLYTL